MPSTMSKNTSPVFDSGFLQNGLVLHHRCEVGRHLQVQISENKQVDKPDLLSLKSVNDLHLPCDIVGLDAKKSKKPVKVRFHPDVLKLAKRSEETARLVYDSVWKLIDEFLAEDWTIEKPQIEELSKCDIDGLRRNMLNDHITMSFDELGTNIHWKISNAPKFLFLSSQSLTKKSKKRNNSGGVASSPNVHFHLNIHPVQESKTTDKDQFDYIDEDTDQYQQRVELLLVMERSAVTHSLFAIDFQSYYPLQENEHFCEFIPDLSILNICIRHSGQRPPSCYGQSAVSISGCHKKMFDCAQIRLELLRRHVHKNHHDLKATIEPASDLKSHSPEISDTYGPIAAAFHNPSPRIALFQLTNTQRPIQMSRFTVTPVNQNESKRASSNRQLHVRVHEEESKPAKTETCTGSPSDSIDSGMPSSPAFLTTDDDEDTLSPLPVHQTPPSLSKNRFQFAATGHTLSNPQPQFRSRSASECLDLRQSGPCLAPNGQELRSILKKPKVLPPGMGNTHIVMAAGLRRAPERFILSRSISECNDDTSTLISQEDLQSIEDDVVSMEDLSMIGNGGTPLSVVDEEASESNCFGSEPQKSTAEQQRKKRVSFNEQVQARIYRSSSSILATKNKQDRKLRNRLRRRAESESDQPINVEDLVHIPTIPLCKLSAEEKLDEEASPSCDVKNKDLPAVVDRRDSGFDSNDSGMDSPPQEEMQVESPKRVQRVISSDSAFGDETME